MLRQVVEVARFTDAPVLDHRGERHGQGAGGARRSTRSTRAPTKATSSSLDCTTIVPDLSGSEFFGHERGAFTGAACARDGAFALADGGTLFLDEVGELPLTLQAELLRVVQEGTYKRVGGNEWRETDFRLVCATNRDLLAEAARSASGVTSTTGSPGWLHRPRRCASGRERHPRRWPATSSAGCSPTPSRRSSTTPVRDFLLGREYPGNVRDLRHLVDAHRHRHVGPGPITLGDIPDDEREPPARDRDWRDDGFERSVRTALERGMGLKEVADAAADAAVRIAVADAGGNLRRASSRLGVTARALQLRRAAKRNGQPTGN